MESTPNATRTQPAGGRAPTATVAICTRDRPELLAEALAALARISGPHEVLVVDSGSVSATTRDVAIAAGTRYLRSDVPGLSIARNVALEAARGDVVVFTDDDCILDQGALDPLIGVFADPSVGAATGTLRDASAPRPTEARAPRVLSSSVSGLDAGHGALMAFRRRTALDDGGFDPLLGAGRRFGGAEDLDMMCRVLARGDRLVQVPASVVTHMNVRDDRDFVALSANYGRGLGAMCRKWLAVDRPDGRRIAGTVVRRGLARLLRRLLSSRMRRGNAAFLRGLLVGYREAARIPIDGFVFVDERPPTPVPDPTVRVEASDPTTDHREATP